MDQEYVVQEGDNLSTILYNLTGDGSYENAVNVAQQNGISNPSHIEPGQVIHITSTNTNSSSATGTGSSRSTGSAPSSSGNTSSSPRSSSSAGGDFTETAYGMNNTSSARPSSSTASTSSSTASTSSSEETASEIASTASGSSTASSAATGIVANAAANASASNSTNNTGPRTVGDVTKNTVTSDKLRTDIRQTAYTDPGSSGSSTQATSSTPEASQTRGTTFSYGIEEDNIEYNVDDAVKILLEKIDPDLSSICSIIADMIGTLNALQKIAHDKENTNIYQDYKDFETIIGDECEGLDGYVADANDVCIGIYETLIEWQRITQK